jgi:hypothetical protein
MTIPYINEDVLQFTLQIETDCELKQDSNKTLHKNRMKKLNKLKDSLSQGSKSILNLNQSANS